MSQTGLLPTQMVDPVTLLDAIGNTPLIRLPLKDERGEIWVKLESANPTGSYKDRMALAMIRGAERDGRLAAGQTVVEYTGGSTGSSLALICALTGHPLQIVTSDAFAVEKLRTMEAFGGRLEVISSPEGITRGLVTRLRERAAEIAAELGRTRQISSTTRIWSRVTRRWGRKYSRYCLGPTPFAAT
jgi:cysteine synthase A